MSKVMKLTQKIGSYEKDGQEKGKYLDVGILLIKDDGQMSVKLDCNPRLDLSDGRLNVYEIKKRENNDGGGSTNSSTASTSTEQVSDRPF